MRLKLLSLIFLFCFLVPVYADDWDDFSNVDRMWDGQKSITNQEFEKVMDVLEQKANVKEEKKKKKRRKKISGGGTSLHEELNPEKEIREIPMLKQNEDGVLLNTPVALWLNGSLLERGFYKVIGEKDKDSGKIFLNFYQSQFFMGKVEADETEDDFEEENIDFVRLIPYNESFVKIIFGSIDFNAQVLVPFKNF